jgi:hypothetical protein
VSGLRGQLVTAAGLVLASPTLALACPVCFNAKDDAARVAFLATTVFLTALPLLMIGGVVMWLTRRAAAADQAYVEPSPELEPAAGTDPAPDVTGARPIPTRG